MIRELAYAKVNLLLHVGARRSDGRHEICSLFASIDLSDTVEVAASDRDEVVCPGVDGTNLGADAIAAYRAAVPELPPLRVTIDKRIPVAGGLGGGSADAAAVLRAADALCGRRLGPDRLRAIGARLGADVPSQIEPRSALVTGAGEGVEPIELPPLALVLLPSSTGLATAEVYGELDSSGVLRPRLEPDALRALARAPVRRLAAALENDLEPAALALRPLLARGLVELQQAGALASRLTGSGPTAFGLFADEERARRAAEGLPGALGTTVRAA